MNNIMGYDPNEGTGGILGQQPMPGWANTLGLISSALSDAGANLNGDSSNRSLAKFQQFRQQGDMRQLYAAAQSQDPAVRQQAYAAIAARGGDPSALMRFQSSQAMPHLLNAMQPTPNNVNVTPQITGPGQLQQRIAAGDYSQPVSTQASLPEALASLSQQYPELANQLAPTMLQSQMTAAEKADQPFDLSQGTTRYDGKGNVIARGAAIPQRPIVTASGQISRDNGQTFTDIPQFAEKSAALAAGKRAPPKKAPGSIAIPHPSSAY